MGHALQDQHEAGQQRPGRVAAVREHHNRQLELHRGVAERGERELGLWRHVLPRRHDSLALRHDLVVGQLDEPHGVDDVDEGDEELDLVAAPFFPLAALEKGLPPLRFDARHVRLEQRVAILCLLLRLGVRRLSRTSHARVTAKATANDGGEPSTSRSARPRSILMAPHM